MFINKRLHPQQAPEAGSTGTETTRKNKVSAKVVAWVGLSAIIISAPAPGQTKLYIVAAVLTLIMTLFKASVLMLAAAMIVMPGLIGILLPAVIFIAAMQMLGADEDVGATA